MVDLVVGEELAAGHRRDPVVPRGRGGEVPPGKAHSHPRLVRIRRLLTDDGLGIVVAHPREIAAELLRWDVTELRRRVAAARSRLTIEANIHRLVELYRALNATCAEPAHATEASLETPPGGRGG